MTELRHAKDRELTMLAAAAKEKETQAANREKELLMMAISKKRELDLRHALSRERERAALRGRKQTLALAPASPNRHDTRVQQPRAKPHMLFRSPPTAPFNAIPPPPPTHQRPQQPLPQQPLVLGAAPTPMAPLQLQQHSEPPSSPKQGLGDARAHPQVQQATSVANPVRQAAPPKQSQPAPIAGLVQETPAQDAAANTLQHVEHSTTRRDADRYPVPITTPTGGGQSENGVISKPALNRQHGSTLIPPSTEATTPAAAELQHDFILSHFQTTGGDQVMMVLWGAQHRCTGTRGAAVAPADNKGWTCTCT